MPPARRVRDIVTIIDDQMIECSRSDECIFLNAEQNARGELWFVAERVIWLAATEENKSLAVERFPAADFSDWWAKRRKAGWRFIP